MDDKTVYLCSVCGLGYLDRETTEKCEEWCRKTGTCSVEITKKAIYFPGLFEKQKAKH
ncbi:MAG: hypothetical protein ACUVQW_07025 [Candidatus Bathycorpusculaceae bacterium]